MLLLGCCLQDPHTTYNVKPSNQRWSALSNPQLLQRQSGIHADMGRADSWTMRSSSSDGRAARPGHRPPPPPLCPSNIARLLGAGAWLSRQAATGVKGAGAGELQGCRPPPLLPPPPPLAPGVRLRCAASSRARAAARKDSGHSWWLASPHTPPLVANTILHGPGTKRHPLTGCHVESEAHAGAAAAGRQGGVMLHAGMPAMVECCHTPSCCSTARTPRQ